MHRIPARIALLRRWLAALAAAAPAALSLSAAAGPARPVRREAAPPAKVDYNRDVRPILAENCFACHGADPAKRQAGLRLDTAEGARERLKSGHAALLPGKPGASELIRRVEAKNGLMMPPAATGKSLTPKQVATLKAWVAQGGEYAAHWAYQPLRTPAAPPTPKGLPAGWALNPVDRFIGARLAQEGLRPSPEADRPTLIRRLSLDLTGLPPTPQEVEQFVRDRSPEAYEKVVDRLLASPQYGERMAVYWLDLVRYADTDGYHGDRHRTVYPYRDYVIDSFNKNKPFDQFTLEQIAGDLLPEGTLEQKIASGYHRLNMTTREGGAQAREYIAKYGAERVRTTSQVWLGATLGCAECHDHKYDPYTAKDFYSFKAFFADIKQVGLYSNSDEELDPVLLLPTSGQDAELEKLDARIAGLRKRLDTATPELAEAQGRWEQALKAGTPGVARPPAMIQAVLNVAPEARTPAQQEALAAHFRTVAPELEPTRKELAEQTRLRTALYRAIPKTLVTVAVQPEPVRVLARGNWMDKAGEVVQPGVPQFLSPLPAGRAADRLALARWLVSRENPLTARVFANRMWMLLFGAGLSRSPGDFGAQGMLPTHPELLDWLAAGFAGVSGSGFQVSGSGNSKPETRDPKLATAPWDVKALIRAIVTSRTYRQSSQASKALRERDPYNLLVARQGRFRLEAEFVRDNALAVSGLLTRKTGGRSVKPYQPAGYWDHCNTFAGKLIYDQDHEGELYRRGVYTYWKRSFLHPAMLAFDAPSREECTVERPRSNTPLQALVLMNDPAFVEAARAFAERIMREGGASLPSRLNWAFRRAVARDVTERERGVLVGLYWKHYGEYYRDREAAAQLLGVGEHPVPKDLDAGELAAWTSIARTILNLHETVTRE